MRAILLAFLVGCSASDAPSAGTPTVSFLITDPGSDTGDASGGSSGGSSGGLTDTAWASDSLGWSSDTLGWSSDTSAAWTSDSSVDSFGWSSDSELFTDWGDSGGAVGGGVGGDVGGGANGGAGGGGDSGPLGGSGDRDSDGDPDVSDCAPDDPAIFSLALEIPADGVDQDCDGRDACRRDQDGDGFASDALVDAPDFDCLDAGEAPAGAPDDCDDSDDQITDACQRLRCYEDLDGDGRGTTEILDDGDGICAAAQGEAPAGGDCDDADDGRYPGATETAGDLVDEDCDGLIACFLDTDGDGFGDLVGDDLDDDCDDPTEVIVGGDCDDAEPAVYPGHDEVVANGRDDDCDGLDACYRDDDGDAFGTTEVIADDGVDVAGAFVCDASAGEAAVSTDCDDANAQISPAQADIAANGTDEDCDGRDGCYADADRDGWGTVPVQDLGNEGCNANEGEAPAAGDCDDGDRAIHPEAVELPANAKDDDCDGVHLCYVDADGDDFGSSATVDDNGNGRCLDRGEANNLQDCDDTDARVNPDASDGAADGVDGDCDGKERCPIDKDEDGYTSGLGNTASLDCSADGFAPAGSPTGDCDDDDNTLNPGATEIPADGIDSDCDGQELCFADADDDGYAAVLGVTAPSDTLDCSGPGVGGPDLLEGDCDDNARRVNPSISEVGGDGIDANCDGKELCFVDADADGYTVAGGVTALSNTPDCSEVGFAASVSRSPDCDDEDASVNPAGEDIPGDGVDQDCSGTDRLDAGEQQGCACDGGVGGAAPALMVLAAAALVRRRRRA